MVEKHYVDKAIAFFFTTHWHTLQKFKLIFRMQSTIIQHFLLFELQNGTEADCQLVDIPNH